MKASEQILAGKDDFAPMSDINVTPFIDVMLVLLIIFMVTAPLMLGGIRLTLPKGSSTALERREKPMVVSITKDNRIFLGSDELKVPNLPEYFKELAKVSTNGEVYVRGDGEVQYARMVELMNELGLAGFSKITLVTESSSPPGRISEPEKASGAAKISQAPAVDAAQGETW